MSAEGRSHEQKPETALEKSLAPRVYTVWLKANRDLATKATTNRNIESIKRARYIAWLCKMGLYIPEGSKRTPPASSTIKPAAAISQT